MFDNYDIELSKIKAGSNAFYEDLFSKKNLAYIVVCVGNDHDNNEMAWDIISYIRQCKMRTVVLRCDEKNIYCYNCEKGVQETISVYVRENIDVALFDRKAIALNYIYCRSNIDDHKTPEEYWMDAGYMDKMSCRASADFTYALCKMAGLDMKELATTGKLDLTAEQLCNLARTEHLRWNAFHHVMGYSKMTDEVLAERIAKYQAEIKANGKTSYRIQKDDERKMHICLVPWEDLDELSKMYNQVTGKNKDYKKDDENNVMLIPELLHISAKNM